MPEQVDEEEPEVIEPETDETETEQIDALLLQGLSLGQVVKKGFARSTVRQRIKKLTKQGKLNNGNLPVKSLGTNTVAEKARIIPEDIERDFELIFNGNEHDRKVFMAGASLPLLGLRLFTESYRPVMELMKVNNQSQLDMAKAAQGGAESVAAETVNALMPQILASMENQAKIKQKTDIASSPKPMQALVARQMERMMDRMQDSMFNVPGQPVKTSMPATWSDERE